MLKNFKIAILLYVEQEGADGDDAFDRALWNLGILNSEGNHEHSIPHPFPRVTQTTCKVSYPHGVLKVMSKEKQE